MNQKDALRRLTLWGFYSIEIGTAKNLGNIVIRREYFHSGWTISTSEDERGRFYETPGGALKRVLKLCKEEVPR